MLPVRLLVRLRVELLLLRLLVERLEERVEEREPEWFAFHAFWKLLISMSITFGPPEVGCHQQHGTRFFTAKLLTVALLLHPE